MSPYRQLPRAPSAAPSAPWWRIAWAMVNGTIGGARERQYRNEVLRDPDGALRRASGLGEVFRIATILNQRGIVRDKVFARDIVKRWGRAAPAPAPDPGDRFINDMLGVYTERLLTGSEP